MKTKYLILIGFLIVFITVIVWNSNRNRQLGKTFFHNFNTANMNGTIFQIERGYNGTLFQLDNDTNEYVFYPYIHR